jgi:AGZA family xanthine/uracil permease-like MFS transporter
VLVARKVKGGMLIGLVGGTVASVIVEAIWHLGSATDHPGGWGLTIPALTGSPVSIPDLSLLGAVDFGFDIGKVGIVALIMLVFTLVFSNFFDAMGTMTGLAKEAGLADEKGDFPHQVGARRRGRRRVVGGATSSSATVFIESGSGIGEGARTGLANVVTGVVFLLAMFFTPLTSIVPTEVAAAALVIVGAMMMAQIKHIDLGDFRVLLPVFLTVSVMPMTYSIANGIGAGFISWVVVRSLSGKARQISPLLWVVAVGFLIYFARGPIQALLGG